MIELRDKTAVVGIGQTRFGRLPDCNAYDLAFHAFKAALEDAGLAQTDIDGLIVHRSPTYERQAEILGVTPRFGLVLPAQGRMCGVAIQLAVMAICAGQASTVAIVYGNDGRSAGEKYGGDASALWAPWGFTSIGAEHALMIRRYMEKYGHTCEELAAISMAFRKHARLNPEAVMRMPMTLEDYLGARYICEPLRLFDYCLINDGGVAMIVTAADRARDTRKRPIYIRGIGRADSLDPVSHPRQDAWHDNMARAANSVYGMAGVGPHDMDALMIYDNFTPAVIFSLESFGFAEPGEALDWVQHGRIELGGEMPTNTSGGHLSESYMQGWGLNLEAVRQLRGECGERQVSDAELVQFIAGTAPISTSVIYRR